MQWAPVCLKVTTFDFFSLFKMSLKHFYSHTVSFTLGQCCCWWWWWCWNFYYFLPHIFLKVISKIWNHLLCRGQQEDNLKPNKSWLLSTKQLLPSACGFLFHFFQDSKKPRASFRHWPGLFFSLRSHTKRWTPAQSLGKLLAGTLRWHGLMTAQQQQDQRPKSVQGAAPLPLIAHTWSWHSHTWLTLQWPFCPDSRDREFQITVPNLYLSLISSSVTL